MITKINQDAMIIRLLPERRAWREILYENLKYNVETLKSLLPKNCRFMAVVKADAYGHGAVPVASYLNRLGIDAFAVATVREGVELRLHGIRGEILVLGYTSPHQVHLLTTYDLIQTAADCVHARALNEAAYYPIKIHIKLDTGMHRLGERSDHIDEIASLFACKNLQICGAYSHLCAADSQTMEDILFTKLQITTFFQTIDHLKSRGLNPGKLHLQSSYGILNYPDLPLDYARIGIAMYGCYSTPEPKLSEQLPLRPVLSLHARIAAVKELCPGETVSYGRNFRAEVPMRIATVTIGYADGLPRSLSNKEIPVLLRGQKTHIIGNICMDQLVIDVTRIPNARPGDIVTLLGTDGPHTLHAEDLAQAAGTITNELLCRLTPREE
jgi:serine/alanine racemase